MSPPLAGLWWCCQARSCWGFIKKEEKQEKGEECGGGKGALLSVAGSGGAGAKGDGEGCPQAEGSGAGSVCLGNELCPSAVPAF